MAMMPASACTLWDLLPVRQMRKDVVERRHKTLRTLQATAVLLAGLVFASRLLLPIVFAQKAILSSVFISMSGEWWELRGLLVSYVNVLHYHC